MSVGKPTLGSEAICFSKGAEQAIPPGEVTVIESVHIQLMMDGVMLGPLQDVSNPTRGTQVTVIEILPQDCEHIEPCPCRERSTQDREHQRAREDEVRSDLDRVFIEGG